MEAPKLIDTARMLVAKLQNDRFINWMSYYQIIWAADVSEEIVDICRALAINCLQVLHLPTGRIYFTNHFNGHFLQQKIYIYIYIWEGKKFSTAAWCRKAGWRDKTLQRSMCSPAPSCLQAGSQHMAPGRRCCLATRNGAAGCIVGEAMTLIGINPTKGFLVPFQISSNWLWL